MIKESIKEILEAGGSVSFGYKETVEEWYGTINIHKSNVYDKGYYISPHGWTLQDVDEAISTFCEFALTSRNIGYVLSEMRRNGVKYDEYDLEEPSPEFLAKVNAERIRVDKKAKDQGIEIKPDLMRQNAINEFDYICEDGENDAESIQDSLTKLCYKYIRINPFIIMSFLYDDMTTGAPVNYRLSFTVDQFRQCDLERAKETTGHNNSLKYKCLEVVLTFLGDDEFKLVKVLNY